MKKIKLTQRKVAFVDDGDFEYLNQWKWCARKDGKTFYAVHGFRGENGVFKQTTMHRLILGAKKGQLIDHIDSNGLNNQRSNLRLCNFSQNQMNRRVSINQKSGLKGVALNKKTNKWQARIKINGKQKSLGYFTDLKDAAICYNENARKLFGDFAKLNDI